MICRCGRSSRPFRMSRHTSSALSPCRVQWPSEGRPSLRLPCIAGAGLCAVRLPAEPKSSWPSARVLPPAEDGVGRLPPRICAMKRSTLRAYGDSLGSSIFSVCPVTRRDGRGWRVCCSLKCTVQLYPFVLQARVRRGASRRPAGHAPTRTADLCVTRSSQAGGSARRGLGRCGQRLARLT